MDQRVYWACEPILYYIGGGVFILFGLLDYWAFQFNPLQINIYLDDSQDLQKSVQNQALSDISLENRHVDQKLRLTYNLRSSYEE